jgi:putative ABC transport system ATP-binding protein
VSGDLDSGPGSGPAILASGVRFAYPRRAGAADGGFALAIERFEVARGARVALWGPSGCGKSTVLDLLAGVLPVACGSLRVAGVELAGSGAAQRRAFRLARVGFVFQDHPLVESLDVLDNVLFPLRLDRRARPDRAVRERARELLARVGLAGREGRRPGELSQGERQRVAIARALIAGPELVLADEPTSGLDPRRAAEVLELLEESCGERRTLLVVSHDPALRERFGTAVAVDSWRVGGPA